MRLDSQNLLDIEQFVQDNAIYYQWRFEEDYEWAYANNPDKFAEREQDNQEEIIEDMLEVYREKLRD